MWLRTHAAQAGLAFAGMAAAVLVAATTGLAASTKPDFALSANPTSMSVQQGQAATYTVTTTASGGFSSSVGLAASGLPTGASASFNPATVTPSSTGTPSTLTVSTAAKTSPGTYNLTVTGTSGKTSHSVALSLTVTYSLNGSYSLSLSPTTVSLAPGGTAAYTVTLSGSPAAPVSLAAYGSWPTGTTATFNPQTVTTSAPTSTLQVATTSATPDGTYTLYVVGKATANGTTSYQYAQTQLVVDSKLSAKPFTITSPPVSGLAPGVPPQPIDLTIVNPNNQPLSVTNLTVAVTSVSTTQGTCATDDFAVTQYAGGYPLSVPANATASLSTLPTTTDRSLWPTVQLRDKTTNQDGCRNATVTLSYSGSATGG